MKRARRLAPHVLKLRPTQPALKAGRPPRGSHGGVPPGPSYVYRAQLTRVIDGDTYVIMMDAGFHVFTEQHVRLHGYSSPELREAGGHEARLAAEALMTGRPLLVQTYKDRQTFARYIADVWYFADDGAWHSVGVDLVALGRATRA